jgi:acyl-coenzyme A synthetase/AMP-(fatty) acid ligase
MSIREHMLEIIEQHGPKVFLIDANTGRQITFREFHQLACSLADELRKRGLRRGDRLGIRAPNSCEVAVLYFAALYIGATIVPMNPNLSANDVRFILSSCAPRFVIASAGLKDPETGIPTIPFVLGHDVASNGDPGDAIDLAKLSEATDFSALETVNENDLLVIVYTSGTTARPKGLAHRVGSMFRNARAFAGKQGIDSSSRFYLTLSMAYMGGFYNLLLMPFLHGSSVVVDHVFDARSALNFWDRTSRHQANTLWFAPTVMSILLKMDRGHLGEEFCRRSVRHSFVGFAPLPLKLKEGFEARYGVRLVENYGLSETLFVTARSQADASGAGYVGEALPGIELRIIADDGTSLSAGQEGEVQILSPDLMAGYLDDQGRLAEMRSTDWFSTGDQGYLDQDGKLFITGRKKDIIIRGGVNVSPAAIEEVLMHAEGVTDVAVVSIPHELYGEDVVAVLKLEPGVELESILDGLMARAKQELAVHQQPARYIAIDEFPRTSNGKVQKGQLRELVLGKFQRGSSPLLRSRPAGAAKVMS